MVQKTGKLSNYSALIEDWEANLTYPGGNQTPPAFIYFENDTAFDSRDELHAEELDNDPEVIRIDKMAIDLALNKFQATYDEKYRQNKPLELWWWHMDKIRARTYPVEFLPQHFRDIYLAAK